MIISSRYVGPASVRNKTTGEFWAVEPTFSKDEERLQDRLIGHWPEVVEAFNKVRSAGTKLLRGPHDSE